MSKDNIIFKKYDDSDKAFILRKGNIIYEVLPDYEFTISGFEKIFGVSEIILFHKYNVIKSRHFTVKKGKDCEYSIIPKKNLIQWMMEYNIGWNIGKHLTEIITNLHKIVLDLEKKMDKKEKTSKNLLVAYANVVNIFKDEAKRKHMDWLNDFVKQIESNPLYDKGIQFIETPSKIEIDENKGSLDKFKKYYNKGEIICKKGDEADSLYILTNGKIKVSIDENTIIDVISDKGSIIGEMAILLNDKRTANMTAIDDTNLISINREEIKDLFQSDPDIFVTTLANLSMRETYNCNYIQNLNDIINQDPEQRQKIIDTENEEYKKQLTILKDRVIKLVDSYSHYEWLNEIYQRVNEKFKLFNI